MSTRLISSPQVGSARALSAVRPNVRYGDRSTSGDCLLSLEVTTVGAAAVVAVAGEADLSNAHLLTGLVDRLLTQQPVRLILDLAGVTFIAAAGMNALVQVRSAASARDADLVLRDPSPIARQVLELTGLGSEFHVQHSAPAQ